MSAHRISTRVVLAATVAVAIIAFVVSTLYLAPRPASLGAAAVTGDDTVAGLAGDALGERGYRGVAAVVVDGDGVRTAGLGDAGVDGPGVTADTPFEIGSVTKTMTGLLLADAITRGEVELGDRVGELVPGTTLADSPTGDVTVEELATHRSGLPRLPLGIPQLGRSALANVTGSDPYAADVADVYAAAAAVDPADGRGEYLYSNLGMAVLGHALAARAGVTYAELLNDRLLEPLGMSETVVVSSSDDLPDGRAVGGTPGGDPRAPWISDGYAPAGVGVWSTATDMAVFAAAALDGSIPGATALEPIGDVREDRRIGLAWQTLTEDGSEITWHNGGTGGFRSFVGLDREAGRAVVLLANTSSSVDRAALDVLVQAQTPDESPAISPLQLAVTVGLLLLLLAAPAWLVVGAHRAGRRYGIGDRLRLMSTTAQAVAALAIGHTFIDWSVVPTALWSIAAGLTAAGVTTGLFRWPALPVATGGRFVSRWANTVIEIAISLGLVALVAVPPAG